MLDCIVSEFSKHDALWLLQLQLHVKTPHSNIYNSFSQVTIGQYFTKLMFVHVP